jgi:hypothetical protein
MRTTLCASSNLSFFLLGKSDKMAIKIEESNSLFPLPWPSKRAISKSEWLKMGSGFSSEKEFLKISRQKMVEAISRVNFIGEKLYSPTVSDLDFF